mgnify:CR=1 FL=1
MLSFSMLEKGAEYPASEEAKEKAMPSVGENLVEGPIVNKEERDDVVADQDDVDDLFEDLTSTSDS